MVTRTCTQSGINVFYTWGGEETGELSFKKRKDLFYLPDPAKTMMHCHMLNSTLLSLSAQPVQSASIELSRIEWRTECNEIHVYFFYTVSAHFRSLLGSMSNGQLRTQVVLFKQKSITFCYNNDMEVQSVLMEVHRSFSCSSIKMFFVLFSCRFSKVNRLFQWTVKA